MSKLQSKPEPRCVTLDGHLYVGVTSAMKLVKHILQEPDEYIGINPYDLQMHCLEGEACHAVALDWLAYKWGLLPEWTVPPWPSEQHNDLERWERVLHVAKLNFELFVGQYDVEPIALEQESLSRAYGLVGHLDLFCFMLWRGRRIKAVIDLKFVASVLRSHFLQVRCYGRLDGFKDATMGFLFHSNRNTGVWKLEEVNLTQGLDDVAAVANAARLWAWAEGKKS